MAMRLVIASFLIIALAASSPAAVTNLIATPDGAQEVPPTGSPAWGVATLSYDDVAGTLDWNISWADLSGPATGMHFHGPAPVGANAGVQVNIGGISGLNSPSVGQTLIGAGQAADLLAGLWYINIHTAAYPSGEIRGQVINLTVATDGVSWSGVKALYR